MHADRSTVRKISNMMLQTVFMEWCHVDISQSFATDNLHQDFIGLCKHLMEAAEMFLEASNDTKHKKIESKGEIQQRLKYLRQLPGTNIPSLGLETERMTAEVSEHPGVDPVM